MTKLIILDLSGVLCVKDTTKNNEHGKLLKEKLELKYYDVYPRPGAGKFINECLKNYDVGIFSSTTYPNVNAILNVLITKKQRDQLKFIWCRDRCSFDPDYGKDENVKIHSTIKKLSNLIESPYVNIDRKYNINNIIAIDDSASKMRFNNEDNYIIIPTFELMEGCDKDDELEKITTLLKMKNVKI